MLISFTQLRKKYNMNITGIIHIGAHYGEEIHEYIRNGIQDIVVFEPLSKNFDILSERMGDVNGNIQGHQVALGNENKIVTMYLSSNDQQSSSILKPKDHLTEHPYVSFEGTEEVEMKRLDEFNIRGANFINIDVQGYELEVLKGGKETLNEVDYVYCEVNRGEMYEGNCMIGEIDDYLSSWNFKRVETFWPETYYKWGDALYIKEK
jgi:FkbM family methyltransferase